MSFSADSYLVALAQTILIDEHSLCHMVTNPSGQPYTRMVPTKALEEWQSVITNPNGLTIANCTYSWDSTSFGACSTSPAWSDYGAYGACSATCGGGTQTRTRTCQYPAGTQTRTVTCRRSDGVAVADSFCTGTKPVASQSCTPTGSCTGSATETTACNTQSCGGTWAMTGGGCGVDYSSPNCSGTSTSLPGSSCSPIGSKCKFVLGFGTDVNCGSGAPRTLIATCQ